MVVRQKKFKNFVKYAVASAIVISLPMVAIDSYYYGHFTVAPFNIIVYNVFTSHGPNLYGVEPFSYYIINGFLNFNFIWVNMNIMI